MKKNKQVFCIRDPNKMSDLAPTDLMETVYRQNANPTQLSISELNPSTMDRRANKKGEYDPKVKGKGLFDNG